MPNIKSLIIQEILKKHKITDYLVAKGLVPDITDGSKSRYTCPLPGHDDSTPSFWVFHNDDHEMYKCFGCSSWGDIINLYEAIEKKTTREVVSFLGEGIEISSDQEWNNLIEQIRDFRADQQRYSMDNYNILISRLCFDYLEQIDFLDEEVRFVEKLLEQVDMAIIGMDEETVSEIYDIVTGKDGLVKRKIYVDNQEEELILNKYKNEI